MIGYAIIIHLNGILYLYEKKGEQNHDDVIKSWRVKNVPGGVNINVVWCHKHSINYVEIAWKNNNFLIKMKFEITC